jgi:hypothetical protein
MLNFIFGKKIAIFLRLFFHQKLHHISTEFLIFGGSFCCDFFNVWAFFSKVVTS